MIVSYVQQWQVQVQTKQNLWGPNVKIILSISNEEGTIRGVCILPHTNRSHSRGGSHLSHEKNTKAMQQEIDRLKRELHHERRR